MENKIWILLLAIYYLLKQFSFQEILGECGEGCLRCVSGVCQICDALNNYIKVDQQCVENPVSNCLISFERNACYQCKTGYYLTGENKCIKMEFNSELKIESCNEYKRADECFACDLQTFKKNTICFAKSHDIENCTLYDNIDTCSMCDFMLPSYNKTHCNPLPQVEDHCLLYTHPLSCERCKPGYELNRNAFLTNNSQLKKFFFHMGFWRQKFYNIVFNNPICERITYEITNCKEPDYDQMCKTCEFGYTLSFDRKSCFIKPLPPFDPRNRVPNCYKFQDKKYEKCQICLEGYYLSDGNSKCIPHTENVDNCQIRSQQVPNTCIQCDNEYYLDEINVICIERQNFDNIRNCAEFNRTDDQCLYCAPLHMFHFNDTRCSKQIENCVIYNTEESILKCKECVSGDYLSDFQTECIRGNNSIEGCYKYKSSKECIECRNKYFLNDAKCLSQNFFYNCELYSVTEKDICERCNEEGANSKVVTECAQVDNPIQNCILYNNLKVCIKCQDDYVVVNRDGVTSCEQLPGCAIAQLVPDPNDSSKQVTECLECMENYMLYKANCINLGNLDNCLFLFNQNTTDSTSSYYFEADHVCQLCNVQKYFKVSQHGVNTYLCVKRSEDMIENCLTYGQDDVGYVCRECRRGFMPSADQRTCNEIEVGILLDGNLNKTYTNAELQSNTHWSDIPSNNVITDHCQIVSVDKTKCLQCKDGQTAMYYSASIQNIVNDFQGNTNFASFKQYIYSYVESTDPSFDTSTKQKNEEYVWWRNPKVEYCKVNSEDDPKLQHKWQFILQKSQSDPTLTTNITYSCPKNIYYPGANRDIIPSTTLYKPYYDYNKLKIHYNLTLAEVMDETDSDTVDQIYLEYYKDANKRQALCDTNTIKRCSRFMTSYQEDIANVLTFNTRMHASCSLCQNNYSLVYRNWTMGISTKIAANYTFPTEHFNWVQTECNLNTAIESYVDNCYVYEELMYYGAKVTICQQCQTLHYPSKSTRSYYICPDSDEHYDYNQQDRCQVGFYCSQYYKCIPKCNSCNANEYCARELGSSICKPRCNTPGGQTCTTDEYCFEGTCMPYAQCQVYDDSWYKHDPVTYECLPTLCQNAFNQTFASRDIDQAAHSAYPQNSDGTYSRVHSDGSSQILYPENYQDSTKNLAVETFFPDGTYFFWYPDDPDEEKLVKKWFDEQGLSILSYDLLDESGNTPVYYNETVFYEANAGVTNNDFLDYDNNYQIFSNIDTNYNEIYKFRNYSNGSDIHENIKEYYTEQFDADQYIIYYQPQHSKYATDNIEKITHDYSDGSIRIDYRSTYAAMDYKIIYPNFEEHYFYHNQTQTIQNVAPEYDGDIILRLIKLDTEPEYEYIYYRDQPYYKKLNTLDGTGLITNFDAADTKSLIEFTPTTNTTYYKIDASSKERIQRYTQGDQFIRIWEHKTDTISYDEYFGTQEKPYPDLIPDKEIVYKSRKDYYLNDVFQNSVTIYKDADEATQLAEKTGVEFQGQLYYKTDYDEITDYAIESPDYHYAIFSNSTIGRYHKDKNIGTFELFHEDGTRNELKADGTWLSYTVDDTEIETLPSGAQVTINFKGEQQTVENGVVTLADKVLKQTGQVGGESVYYLDDSSIYQGETNDFYYKITKSDGSLQYKLKNGFTYFSIDATQNCESHDKDLVITKYTQASDTKFLMTSENQYYQTQVGTDPVVASNPLESLMGAQTLLPMTGGCLDTVLTPDQPTQFPTNEVTPETPPEVPPEVTPETPVEPTPVAPVCPDLYATNCNHDFEHQLYVDYTSSQKSLQVGNIAGVNGFRSSYLDYVKYMGFDESIDYYLLLKVVSTSDFTLKEFSVYQDGTEVQEILFEDLEHNIKDNANNRLIEGDFALSKSDFMEEGVKVGDGYLYTLLKRNFKAVAMTNNTFYITTMDGFYNMTFDTNQELREHNKTKKRTWYNNGTYVDEPSYHLRTYIDGTETIIEDILTKTNTTTNTDNAGVTVTTQVDGFQIVDNNGIKTHKFLNDTIMVQNGNTYTYTYYNYQLPMLEAYWEEEYNNDLNKKTVKYFDLTTEIEKVITLNDGSTQDYRRNGTVVYTDAIGNVQYVYDANNDIQYDKDGNIQNGKINGVQFNYDIDTNTFLKINEDNTIIRLNLNDVQVITSTDQEVPSITNFPNGRKAEHSDYTKSSIYFNDKDQYNLIIDGIQRTYISKDFGSLIFNEFQLIHERPSGNNVITITYDLKTCQRTQESSLLKKSDQCSIQEFGNGDIAFNYSDQIVLFKVLGELQFINRNKLDDIQVVNMAYSISTMMLNGIIKNLNVGNGDALQMQSELRYYIFNNSTQMIDNLHKDIRIVNSEDTQSTTSIIYYADGMKESIITDKNTNDKNVQIIKANKDEYQLSPTQEIYKNYNNYTLTKDISTGVIEKNYVWHPFIAKETYTPTDTKQVDFKQRYQQYYNIKSMIYKADKVYSQIDLDDQTWTYNDQTLKFEFDNKTYDPATRETVTTATTDTQIIITTDYQYGDLIQSITYSDLSEVLQITEKYYKGYKETYYHTADPEYQLVVEYDNGYTVKYPTTQNPDPTTQVDKTVVISSDIFGEHDYSFVTGTNFVKNYNVDYQNMIQIDYTDRLIYIRADELINNDDITLFNTMTLTGAPITLTGSIVANGFTAAEPVVLLEEQQILIKTLTAKQTIAEDLEITILDPVHLTNGVQTRVVINGVTYLKVTDVDDIEIDGTATFKAIGQNAVTTSTSETLRQLVLTDDIPVKFTSVSSTYEQAATQTGTFATAELIDGNIQGLTIEDITTFDIKDGYATTTGTGTSTVYGGTFDFDSKSVAFSKNPDYPGYMIYDGSTGTVSNISSADYLLTTDPIYHKQSDFTLKDGWNNDDISISVKNDFTNVLLTGQLTVNGATSTFGHSSSSLSVGSTFTSDSTSVELTNMRVRIPGSADITCADKTDFLIPNVNVNSTGNKGVHYNVDSDGYKISDMVIKAPWSLAPSAVGASIKPTIVGGTVTLIDAEVTDSKSNGQVKITGKYKITNPVITGWDTIKGVHLIEIISGEVTGNNGQLNYDADLPNDVTYVGTSDFAHTQGCTWSFPGTTNTGKHIMFKDFNLTSKVSSVVWPNAFSFKGTEIKVIKFKAFNPTGGTVQLILNDDTSSDFTLSSFADGMEGEKGVFQNTVLGEIKTYGETSQIQEFKSNNFDLVQDTDFELKIVANTYSDHIYPTSDDVAISFPSSKYAFFYWDGITMKGSDAAFYHTPYDGTDGFPSTGSTITMTDGVIASRTNKTGVLQMSDFSNDSIEVAGSAFTFDSIFTKDTGTFATDTITTYKPVDVFTVKSECQTSTTNVQCTVIDTATTAINLVSPLNDFALNFAQTTDGLKLDATADTAFTIDGTSTSVKITAQEVNISSHSMLNFNSGSGWINITNEQPWSATYPPKIKFNSDTTFTTSTFQVTNEKFSVLGDGPVSFTGNIQVEMDEKDLDVINYSGDKYELDIKLGNNASLGSSVEALTDGVVSNAKAYTTKGTLFSGKMVLETGSTIHTKGTTFIIPTLGANMSVTTTKAIVDDPNFVGTGLLHIVGGNKIVPEGMTSLQYIPQILSESDPLTMLYGTLELSLFDNQDEWIKDRQLDYGLRYLSSGEMVKAYDNGFIERYLTDGTIIKQTDYDERYVQVDSTFAYLDKLSERLIYYQTLDATGAVTASEIHSYDNAIVTQDAGNTIYTYSNGNIKTVSDTQQIFNTGTDYEQTKNFYSKNIQFKDLTTNAAYTEQNYEYYNFNWIMQDGVTYGMNDKGQTFWSKDADINTISNDFIEFHDNGAGITKATTNLDRHITLDNSGTITYETFKGITYSLITAGNVNTYDYTDYTLVNDSDNNTQQYTYKATNAVSLKNGDTQTITYDANFIVTHVLDDYFTIQKDNVIEKCDKNNLLYTKTTDGVEDTQISGYTSSTVFGETVLSYNGFYCSFSKNILVLKSSQGSYVINLDNTNYYRNDPSQPTHLKGYLFDGKNSSLSGGYFFLDEKIYDPITGKLMKFRQDQDMEETILDQRAINNLKRFIKTDLKEQQELSYGKFRNFEQDKSRKEVLQNGITKHDKFTQHQLYLRPDNYFTELDLLLNTVWSEGIQYPKTLNLLKNQVIRKYSDTKSTRVFWSYDFNNIYYSTQIGDVNYFNDFLHSESSINTSPLKFGYTTQYHQSQRLYSFTENLWYVYFASDDSKILTSTALNSFQNSDSSITYIDGVQTETTGTVVKQINLLSQGRSQDGADASTEKLYSFAGVESYNIDEAGIPMIQENNVYSNYVAKYDPATQIKTYVYENLVEISDDQGISQMTYTYPALFAATEVVPPLTTAVVDYSSNTVTGVTLNVANGDTSVNFTFEDRNRPSAIMGNVWNMDGQGYSVSYTGGGVSKTLYFQQMEDDFMVTYNSYMDSNAANQVKFSYYSFDPFFTIFHGDVDNYYTYYFLNGTALTIDERNVEDKTKEYHYLDQTSTLYAKEYFKQTDAVQAYTEYYSDPTKTITHIFAENKITYTFPEYDRILQYDTDGTTMLTETTNFKIINQGLEQTIYDYQTQIETGNFQNSTVRAIQADPLDANRNMTSWTYSNGTIFTSKLFQIPQGSLEYHEIIQYDNDLTYTIFPNETIKTSFAGNETYFLQYGDENVANIEKYTTADENLIYRRSDFLTGDNAGDYQIFHQSTQNTTYFLTQYGFEKIINPQNSYTIDYPYPSPKDPVEQEKYYSLTDTMAFSGDNAQTDAPASPVDFKIYYYINDDIKEQYYNADFMYKEVYKFTNSTIKTTNYNLNSIDQVIYDFRLDVAGVSQWWKKMEIQYFDYGKETQKMHKITKTNYQDAVTIENFFATKSATTIPDTIKINENPIVPTNGDQVFINNSTHARRNEFYNQYETLEVFIDGTIFKDNMNVLHHEDQQSQEYEFQNRTRKLIFDNRNDVFLFPDEFIYSGCWWSDEVCARNKCYFNLKCRCAQDEYCEWDPAATDGYTYTGKNVCVKDSNCDQCKLWNKYCWKFFDHNDDPYYQCRDEPQESLAPTSTCTPDCEGDEMCINGHCVYKGNPCYFKNPSTAVFCAIGEICYDQKCYQGCRPTCQYYQDCIYNSSGDNFICQDREPGLPLTSIMSCNKIDHCIQTNEFGECQRCETNYSMPRETVNGLKVINRQLCVLTNVANCDIAKQTGSDSYVCEDYSDIVLAGELLVHKGCHQGFTYQSGQCISRTENCLDYDELGHCRFCSSNYSNEVWYSVYAQYDYGVCTEVPSSPELFSDDVEPAEKEKLFNCKYFSYYYPIATSQKPIDAISEGKNYCEVCMDTHYINFNKYCLPKNIQNCEIYDDKTTWNNRDSSVCLECQVGYLLSSNQCVWQGPPPEKSYYNLPKCIAYKIITQTINDYNLQTYQCIQCEAGYSIFETNVINYLGQNAFCFLDSPYRDCNTIDTDYFTETGKIKCKECKPIRGAPAYPFEIQQEKDFINTCVFIPKRSFCKYHQLKSLYDNTNLECQECESTHYLYTYKPSEYDATSDEDPIKQIKICKLRLNIVDGCIEYYIDQDACKQRSGEEGAQIAEGQSLPVDVQTLLNSPPPSQLEIENEQLGDWIMGCEIYKDAKNCHKCYAPKYLNPEGFDYNNRCVNVDIVVPNCKYYNQYQECEECENFYLLIDKQCRLKKVKNCAEYLNEYTCKSCPVDLPYKDQDGNCSKHPSNPWCKTYQIFSNQEILFEDDVNCETCQEGYYPDNNDKCNLLKKQIPHCKYYYAETLCKECEQGFYLKFDGKRCVINPQFDTNCESFIYKTQCSVCRFRYVFEGDQCVPCGQNLEEGCAYCDPANKDQCFMCRIGYTMKDGICQLVQGENSQLVTDFAYSQLHVSTIQTSGIQNEFGLINGIVLILYLMLII